MSLTDKTSTHLSDLRAACGSWRKKAIKALITSAEDCIKQNIEKKENLDFMVLVKPFVEAYENEGEVFQDICLDAFIDLFQLSSLDSFPTIQVLDRTIQALFTTDKKINDNLKIKCCKTILTILSSPAGTFYMHGKINYKIIIFLTAMYGISISDEVRENVSNTICEIIDYFIKVYKKKVQFPKFSTIKQLATFHVRLLMLNSVFIADFAPNSYRSTISDVDLILLIRAFTKKISNGDYDNEVIPVVSLCCDGVYYILDNETPFTRTTDFHVVLRTDIHVGLLTLLLDTHEELVEPTAKLIDICWRRYVSIYLQQLNDLLSHGIITALSSSLPEVIERAFNIFSYLIINPQFLIDAFVNYDCDHSGSFRNIFEQTVNLIVNNAYPNQVTEEHQVNALRTIVNVLSCLWKYFNQFEMKMSRDNSEEQILDAKKAKDIMDHAFQLFKRSPKKGLQFFIDHSIVDDTPKAIADFLYNTSLLDLAGIGQIIGSENNINILKHYVEHFDFKHLSFEQSFRKFLSKFIIPGEAQMIDRIMEQFGVKFYNDNIGLFSCADTVYVLAFSTLMLHTDAHHPNVKTKMTLEEFVSNNKGIDGGKDLPFAFLESLYNNITSERIFISQSPMPSSSLLTRQQLKELYQQQCKETLAYTMKKTNSLGPDMSRKYHRAESPNLVGPMFHIVWGQILGALTMAFEATDNPDVYNECIKGFELCMHIASHCYVEDALDTLVDSFAKFSRLRIQTAEGMKPKNFKVSSSLVQCAIQDHNFLKGVWSIVLGEISAMDKMREDMSIAKVLIVAEHLFAETLSLDRESILDFVTAMCELATSELQEDPPRPYLLTKFSDVAYYNMDRPMFIWKDIWTVIGDFLAYAGKSDNESIAATVVDVIRQLSRKFLKKKEINEFHFQQHFLQPFIEIFDGQTNKKVKGQILYCIDQIINELSDVLHSGWDVIFQILTLASLETNSLKSKAFKLTEAIITTYIKSVAPEKVHLMFVLMSFVQNSPNDIDLACSAVGIFNLISNIIETSDHDGWECLLQTLTKCTFIQSDNIKMCAEEAILSIITKHGCQMNDIDDYIWNFFFENVLKKIFVKKSGEEYSKNRLNFFKLMFDHLFFKYASFFGKFSMNILNILLFCCKFPNRELSFLALKYLCNYLGDDDSLSSTLPDVELFIEPLIEAVPELVKFDSGSVLIVDVVEKTLKLCSEDQEKKTYLVQILMKMCDECTDDAACAALKLLYKTLLDDKNYDEIVNFITKPFIRYNEEQHLSDKIEWDNLIVYFLKEINKLNEDYFDKCINSLSKIIKKIIETESLDVRKEIIVVLKRKFIQ